MTVCDVDISDDGCDVVFSVCVTPKASRTGITCAQGGVLKIAVTAPPEKGKANAAVVAILAKALGVARSRVTIEGSQKSRAKRVRVSGAAAADVSQRIEKMLSQEP